MPLLLQFCLKSFLSVQFRLKKGEREMKRLKNEIERKGGRERKIPLMFSATTHHKVNSKGLLKMHDMHTTRK